MIKCFRAVSSALLVISSLIYIAGASKNDAPVERGALNSQPAERGVLNFQPAERGVFNFLFGESCPKCRCGSSSNTRQRRLMGGLSVTPHEYPWLAQINIRGLTSVGGTLISDRYVITAASPLVGLTPYEMKVTLGRHDRCRSDVTEVTLSVEEVILHSDYGASRRAHDLALLRLSNRVTFSSWITPICLPSPGFNFEGSVGNVVSWSDGPSDLESADNSCEPKKIGLPIVNQRDCNKAMDFQGCVGVIGSISPLCPSDAGSGLLYRTRNGLYELIGVLSDVTDCRKRRQVSPSDSGLTLYTKVQDHFEWIFNNVKKTCFCGK